MREGLPPIGVVDDVADRSLAVDRGDSPVESDAIAGPAFVFTEGNSTNWSVRSAIGRISDLGKSETDFEFT
ncbi:MAG: hypothetical protein Rhob2KO_51250 [Rhodopirellula baltica]